MISIHNYARKEVINAGICKWWLSKVRPEIGAEQYFSQVDDELVHGNSDTEVGLAVFSVRDYWSEFLKAVDSDPATKFLWDSYGLPRTVRNWIAKEIGFAVRKTEVYKNRLAAIKAAQRKIKKVKQVLKS